MEHDEALNTGAEDTAQGTSNAPTQGDMLTTAENLAGTPSGDKTEDTDYRAKYKSLQPEYTRVTQENALLRRRLEELQAGHVEPDPAEPIYDEHADDDQLSAIRQRAVDELGGNSELVHYIDVIAKSVKSVERTVKAKLVDDYAKIFSSAIEKNPKIKDDPVYQAEFGNDLDVRLSAYGGWDAVTKMFRDHKGNPRLLNEVRKAVAQAEQFANNAIAAKSLVSRLEAEKRAGEIDGVASRNRGGVPAGIAANTGSSATGASFNGFSSKHPQGSIGWTNDFRAYCRSIHMAGADKHATG